MRTPRLHVDARLAANAEIELPALAGGHAVRVLRLRVGDAVVLFNGDGFDHDAELVRLDKRGVVARVHGEGRAVDRESPLRLTLAQGIARGEKMDLILQKATELGVARIVPLVTSRTEVRLDAERTARRLAHWRSVIASACEQCGRAVLPELDAPCELAAWADTFEAAGTPDDLRLILDPDGDETARDLAPFRAATLAIGPEGGLADTDRVILRRAGFRGLRLGPRILRTETAGLAAIAALQALHGDL
jgi:16S rRNA (uracil1498-N3)-methyltransferase